LIYINARCGRDRQSFAPTRRDTFGRAASTRMRKVIFET
jgi:hypothetical protein